MALGDLPVDADLGQEVILGRQAAAGELAGGRRRGGGDAVDRLGVRLGVGALEAEIDRHRVVHQRQRILDVELACLPIRLLHPLGAGRLTVQIVGQAERSGHIGADIARGAGGVLLEPEAGLDVVGTEDPAQAAQHARTIDGVAGVADLNRHVVGRRRCPLSGPAGDEVVAGALVRMAIDLGVDLQIVRQIVVAGQIIEVVVAQDLTIGEGHVRVLLRRGRRNAFGRRRRIGHAAIGDAEIRLPVGRIAGPVPTQPVQHVLGQIGVVRLVGARQVGEGGDGAAIEAVHGLAVELTAPGRLVVALVHEQVLLAVLTGHIGREAVVLARVHTQEAALGRLAAEALAGGQAERTAGIARGVDQGAAQIAGGRDGQAGDAGGQVRPAQVLGNQRAADRQAVIVVIGAVAQRHAVQRIAQVGRVEPPHLQGQRLLVDAQGVDRLGADARQEVQRLLDAGARRQGFQIGRRQGRNRAGLTRSDHHDLVQLIDRRPLHDLIDSLVGGRGFGCGDPRPSRQSRARKQAGHTQTFKP